MKAQKLLGLVLATVMVAGIASCKKNSSEGEKTLPVYKLTYNSDMYTMDYLNTYHASDSEILVNLVDGLIEHDEYGILQPALATKWEKTVVDGNDVWTFTLREGVKWVTNEGEEYAEVTAEDFVTGMHHVLDTGADALGYIVWGVVKNAYEYYEGTVTDFAQVGVSAKSKYEVVYTLEGQVPYFERMIEYNPFMPMNKKFFEAQDGQFGVKAWHDGAADCSYGRVGIPSSILYNGAFLFSKYASKSVMELSKNEKYWDAAKTTLSKIQYVYDDGSNPQATFASFEKGDVTAMGISASILDSAKAKYADNLYVTEGSSTTYYGAFNFNRQTYSTGSVVSTKTEAQKVDTQKAIWNKNFRRAIQAGFDVSSYHSVVVGEELKNNRIRNTLTAPEFVTLESAAGGYAAGKTYGEVVEAEYKKLNTTFTGSLADSQSAYYNTTAATAFKAAAKTELGSSVTWPIHLDIVYYSPNTNQTKQAQAFKASIERSLGTDFVVVELMSTAVVSDYYACGYRAYYGEKANYDFFYGSGWGPDYGDPLTYLNIFGYGNDMMSVIGIGNEDGTYEADDEAAFVKAFGAASSADYTSKYDEMLASAKSKTGSERYVEFAKLEAYFLDTAAVIPMQTEGGNYALTRVQPRTVPNTLYGTDNEKLKHLIIHDHILTAKEVADFRTAWKAEKQKRIDAAK